MKQFKDVAHLYHGCTVQIAKNYFTQERKGTFLGFADLEKLSAKIAFRAGEIGQVSMTFFKPILRSVHDLTKKELLAVFSICYKDVYDVEPELLSIEQIDETGGGRLIASHEDWCYDLMITPNQVYFSANGSILHIPVFQIAMYLLSIHIDLFGLIESEQAIHQQKL